MGRYLDPKSDIVFKKVFGQHPHLLKSFLNAILPLQQGELIESLEYLPSEQIPDIPILKRTIVDVKCYDQQGKIFIVEMQIEWTDSFIQRLLYGTASAYVKQLNAGEAYHLLNPVYGLGLINSIYDHKTADWYHHYGLVKLSNHREEVIKGLTLVFVELPKFVPTTHAAKKLQVLWLRFMREINDKTREVDPSLLEVPEIKEAVRLTEEAAYSPAELDAYESYWKAVSSEKTLLEERVQKVRAEEKIEIAKKMKTAGIPYPTISECTGLSHNEIEHFNFYESVF